MLRPVCLIVSVGTLTLLIASPQLRADDEPLHERIDRLIEARAEGPMSEPVSDAAFARRIYLDLAGRIPRMDELRAFLANESTEKRTKLVDRLLAGPEYARRMQELFHVMLMERRGEDDAWRRFLLNSFRQDKPWDRVVAEIANPPVDDENARGAAYFITERLEKYGQNPTDYPGLVRDFGRLFLGVDVQCAQCHDHLHIDDYKQEDFQGLLAFLGNTAIRRGTDFPAVEERPLKAKLEFMSVFIKEPRELGPRLPGGEEFVIPAINKGEEYTIPPDKKNNQPGVLTFSTLRLLAEQLPRADNELFCRNLANRLWFIMLGRGLVDPLDLMHSDNPPTHPELLDLLSREVVAHDFHIKPLLRELALTRTYQRSTKLPEGETRVRPESYRTALERPLSAEQMLRSALLATGQWEIEFGDSRAAGEKLASAAMDTAAGAPADSGNEGRQDEEPDSGGDAESAPQPIEETEQYRDYLERFRTALANAPKEPELEFSPSVKAALFLSNNALLLSWLEPKQGNLVARLAEIEDPQAVADELYLAVLSRPGSEEELAETAAYLGQPGEGRAKRVGLAAWALLASSEFCLNH